MQKSEEIVSQLFFAHHAMQSHTQVYAWT